MPEGFLHTNYYKMHILVSSLSVTVWAIDSERDLPIENRQRRRSLSFINVKLFESPLFKTVRGFSQNYQSRTARRSNTNCCGITRRISTCFLI